MTDENNIEKIDLDKVDWRGSREFFESLGETLDKLDDKDEAYNFTWVGKRKAVIEAGAPINKTFRPDVDNSKNWDTTENLFIEGDNLDALKLLQESYLGKVKMIYIDPPYNTGKDFVYHDNFKASVESYDEDTEYKDDSGNIQFKKNEKTNGRYHSDWLSMMYPRLKLAHNLLTDDGVIFISIDDSEAANLKKLCDEILDERNFVAQFVWQSSTGGGLRSKYANTSHQYVLCYVRETDKADMFWAPLSDEAIKMYNQKNEKGIYRDKDFAWKNSSAGINQKYPIVAPDGEIILPKNGYIYRFIESRFKEELSAGNVTFKKTSTGPFVREDGGQANWNIYIKKYLNDAKGAPVTVLPKSLVGINNEGTTEVQDLLGGRYFESPKNVRLMTYLLATGTSKDCVVLDFFSGSGSTAHAVMQLNAEDGGTRKFAVVQLSEKTDKNSEAHKAGFKTIPEISRERIRRAGDNIASEYPEAKVDYGFRSLVIADTNYKEIYKPAGEQQQSTLLDLVDNIKDDRSELDLLYGILTQSALELNRPFESKVMGGSSVFLYDYFGEVSGLAACFSTNVPEETIKEIAKLKPLTAVFRDSSFTTSQDKVNLAEHFRILSPDTKVKVI